MKGQWDGMVTCFFMDTAPVVFEYVETIWSCLKAGGVWVNQGPLLYHWCVFTCFIILLSFPLCLSLCLSLSLCLCVSVYANALFPCLLFGTLSFLPSTKYFASFHLMRLKLKLLHPLHTTHLCRETNPDSVNDHRYDKSVELSWEELKSVIVSAGFKIVSESYQQVTSFI